MTATDKVFGLIGAMNTLTENFPMGILDMLKGKSYNSVFDFLLDVLDVCGVPYEEIVTHLLKTIFNIKSSVIERIDDLQNAIEDAANEKVLNADSENSFIKTTDEAIKTALMGLLSSIFTCSAPPIIPTRFCDKNYDENTGKSLLTIPVPVIDFLGILDESPLSDNGKVFYSVEGRDGYYKKIINTVTNEYEYTKVNKTEYKGITFERLSYVPKSEDIKKNSPEFIKVYSGLNPNTLYKSNDMNAFIWYVLNKGMKTPQVEKNHMMWNDRIKFKKELSAADLNWWYSSKDVPDGEFDEETLQPILQLIPNNGAIDIQFPSQTYFKPTWDDDPDGSLKYKLTPNATIYKFNWDYLNSIQILKPKILLQGLIDNLLGFTVNVGANIKLSPTRQIIRQKLASVIKKIVEADDMEVEDCYASFTNEEYNQMMEEMLLAKYNSTLYDGTTENTRTHDLDRYQDLLDDIVNGDTTNGTVEKLTKLINEITVIPGVEGEENFGLDVSFNVNGSVDNSLLKNLLWAIMLPIVESVFTPQVMLLIMTNLSLTGVVKMDDFMGKDFGKIHNFLLNRLMSLTSSIGVFIKTAIINILLDFIKKKLVPLVEGYLKMIAKEKLEDWLRILTMAIEALRLFLKINKAHAEQLDNVNYADILTESEQTTPESVSSC